MSTGEDDGSPDEEEGVSGKPYTYPAATARVEDVPRPPSDAQFSSGRRAMAAASAASIGAASASGYYSVSSSAAASDVDYDMEGERMAVGVAAPAANNVTDAGVEEGLARRVVSA
eukprot:CAMPEP_0113559418 /NCGR_PEP_ID=MMETSP0015_2-20120614/18887_1 /TAXON_ID=2838 /ORGANISM="Odontella" /LENGTH=114 /DNA_ID=CAMNT_0000461055 /DNA_START=88 /DNA_END=432 /DNA_ORIENTATION=+ /assembly_acc=CAM_ASM_000160